MIRCDPTTVLSSDGVTARRRFLGFGLIGVVALGFVGFANSTLVTAVLCLTIGAQESATAFWLWRTDPVRRRGRAAALAYLAVASLAVSLGSFGYAMVIMLATRAMRPDGMAGQFGPDDPLPDPALAAVFACILGLPVAWFFGTGAVVAAIWHRCPIWIGGVARRARRRGVWPPWVVYLPMLAPPPAKNQMRFVLYAVFIPWLLLLLVADLVLTSHVVPGNSMGVTIMIVTSIATFVGLPYLALPRLERWTVAATPQVAWKVEAP